MSTQRGKLLEVNQTHWPSLTRLLSSWDVSRNRWHMVTHTHTHTEPKNALRNHSEPLTLRYFMNLCDLCAHLIRICSFWCSRCGSAFNITRFPWPPRCPLRPAAPGDHLETRQPPKWATNARSNLPMVRIVQLDAAGGLEMFGDLELDLELDIVWHSLKRSKKDLQGWYEDAFEGNLLKLVYDRQTVSFSGQSSRRWNSYDLRYRGRGHLNCPRH